MDIDIIVQSSAMLSYTEIVGHMIGASEVNSEECVDGEGDEQLKTVTVISTEAKQNAETLRNFFLINGGEHFLMIFMTC